ncbi:MAG TPA: beta-galactosidase [Kofleriaceae bacterium]
MGALSGTGQSLAVTSRYLELDGRPWFPIMGEFHYSRYPADEWEVELLKMRAGGVDIVASYVFWNHHEEIEGVFDWSGRRDLGRFVRLAARAGLRFFLRPGPWVHAESRNGGFPDWLLATGELRCNDARYLERVARFYGEIGAQLRGLMWGDGGPVLGVQLENEYHRTGPGAGAEHIAELKRLAIAAGLTVPLYTVTGWPTLDIPPREVVPVSGAYPDGFWFGDSGPLAPSGVFVFNTSRAIGEMGNVEGTPADGHIDRNHYPFFLAEAGGGMHVSYHRRPVVSTDDVAATALVQIGSGATLYGYYMYHGGVNPRVGVNETQASGYPNDVPILGYDFRAPLGQYGQMRASYGRLRTLHQFVAAFGSELAAMESVLPDGATLDAADRSRLRVAVRGAGDRGFVFLNHHVRHHAMPDAPDVRVRVETPDGPIDVPAAPIAIPAGAYVIWPIGLRLGAARLRHATVQPLTRWNEDGRETLVCFRHPAIPAELAFDPATIARLDAPDAWVHGGSVRPPAAELLRFAVVDAAGVPHTIVLLDQALADRCLAVRLCGRDRLVLCAHGVHADGDQLVVSAPHDQPIAVALYPADDLAPGTSSSGDLVEYRAGAPAVTLPPVEVARVADHPTPPPLRMGPSIAWRKRAVPLAPDDAAYEQATRVRVRLPGAIPTDQGRVILALDYVGDAARLYADGQLVDDHFYDGEPWLVGVDRFASAGRWPALELAIIAAGDLPVFMEPAARARLAAATRKADLCSARVEWWRTSRFDPRNGDWQ